MNSTIGLVLYMGFFFGLMYFLIIRPQKKKTKQMTELRNSVQSGDEVVTIGGVVGRVLNIKEDEVVIEVGAARTKLTFKKWAISTIDKGGNKAIEAQEVEIEE